ncbi:MAG: Hsp20/alpha crystallin family protein [Chitinophagaceae bacterium]
MTLVKFNQKPFEGSFNNFFDDLVAGFPVINKNEALQEWKGFVPVNIKETEKNYSIEIVAPGFEKNDFKVSLDQQILTVSAEKQNEVKADADSNQNEKQIRKEYSYRSFKRSFTLNEKTDGSAIDAKYVNGVLTLNLPKKEEVKPAVQQINIQ